MVTAEEKLTVFLTELDHWISSGGDPAVPPQALGRTTAGKAYPLGRRAQYLRARRHTLPDHHVAALELRTGWVWDLSVHRWLQRYQEVVDHLERFGGYQGLPKPASMWILRAREDLRAGRLSPAQEQLVQCLPRRGGVERFLAAAYSWLAQHPDETTAQIPANTTVVVDEHPYQLGRAIAYYRRRAAGQEGTHPLGDRERALIERLPGWTWERPRT